MKPITRIASLLFAALLFASCAGESDTPAAVTTGSVTETNTAETEPADMLDARLELDDNLPEKDYGGTNFNIIIQEYTKDDYIPADGEESGALINDAVFRRNTTIEERFNVSLVLEALDAGDVTATVRRSVNAGDNAYQLVSNSIVSIAPLAIENGYLDWNSLEYVDLTRPWWNQSCRETITIDDKIFMMAGSISPGFLTHTYCVYLNKRHAADIDLLETIYDTVFDGKWTIDKYISLVKDSWRDLNGNGEKDDYDFYGLAAQVTSYTTPFIYSFGETTVTPDSNGIPQITINEEKAAAMVEKVYTLLYDSNGTITTDGWGLHSETFLAGRALFMNGVFVQAIKTFTDMEDDYAIIPYPKWNEEQEEYLTMSDGASPMVAVPTSVEDPEMVGIITEALAAEAYKRIIPAVYDNAIKVRGTRDEESMKLIDIIERGNVVDFGYIFGDYNTMGFYMSKMMGSKNKNFASFYEKQKKTWQKKLDKVINAYLDSQ